MAAIGPLVSEAQVKTQAQIILEDLQVRQNRIFEAYAKEQNPIDKSSMESRLYAIRAEYQSLFSKNENNLFLHAKKIEFKDSDDELVNVEANLPNHFFNYI